MNMARWTPFSTILPLLLTLSAPSRAQEEPPPLPQRHAPWFITSLAYGAGALEYYDDQEAILRASLTLQPGVRYRAGRYGAILRWLNTGDSDNFIETGLFVSGDLFSIEQDRHRTAGLYAKLEGSARFSLDRPDDLSMVFAGCLGLRVFGLFLEAGFGPVIGPLGMTDLDKAPVGMTGEGRAGLELIEFISCFKAGCFGGRLR